MVNTVVMQLLSWRYSTHFFNINFRCDSSVVGTVNIFDYGHFTCDMASDSVVGVNVISGRAMAEADIR
jgi:hypothetical protein